MIPPRMKNISLPQHQGKRVYLTLIKRFRCYICVTENKCTLKQNFCSNLDLNTFSNNIIGTSYHLKGNLFKINPKTANDNKITELRTILQRESQNSSTIKKKEAARIEYPGVKPIIHQSELRTYTKKSLLKKIIPFALLYCDKY